MFRRRDALWLVTTSGLGALGCQDEEDRAGSAGGGEAGEPGVAGGSGADPAGGAGGEGGGVVCAQKPQQTLGPFPNKAQLERSDIRSGQAGVPLHVTLRVASVFGCVPVLGATVELWQCNADGDYSEYSDFGTADQNWLRGFQLTNALGVVEFVTIYPGWYPGRSVHLHFRVKRSGRPDFVSQLYFDDALSDTVLSQAPYTAHVGVRPRNEDDGIFVGGGGSALLLSVQSQADELRAVFDIGVPA